MTSKFFPVTVISLSVADAFSQARIAAEPLARDLGWSDFFLELKTIGQEAPHGKFNGLSVKFYFEAIQRTA